MFAVRSFAHVRGGTLHVTRVVGLQLAVPCVSSRPSTHPDCALSYTYSMVLHFQSTYSGISPPYHRVYVWFVSSPPWTARAQVRNEFAVILSSPTGPLPQEFHYLVSITVSQGKVFGLFVRSPTKVGESCARTGVIVSKAY